MLQQSSFVANRACISRWKVLGHQLQSSFLLRLICRFSSPSLLGTLHSVRLSHALSILLAQSQGIVPLHCCVRALTPQSAGSCPVQHIEHNSTCSLSISYGHAIVLLSGTTITYHALRQLCRSSTPLPTEHSTCCTSTIG